MDCPWCAEAVDEATARCPHCGEFLSARESIAHRPSSSPLKIVLGIVALILIVPMLCMCGGIATFSRAKARARLTLPPVPAPPPVASADETGPVVTHRAAATLVAIARAQRARVDRGEPPSRGLGPLLQEGAAVDLPAGYELEMRASGVNWRAVAASTTGPSFAIGPDGVVIMSARPIAPDLANELPDDATPYAGVAPPPLPADCLFGAGFLLAGGERSRAGHIFPVLVEPEAGVEVGAVESRTILLTALHLLGPSGGLPEVATDEVEARVARLWLLDRDSGHGVASVASPGIGIAGAAPLGVQSSAGDAVAFLPPAGVDLGALRLARRSPPPGAEVWLAARMRRGAPEGRRLHRAVVSRLEDGLLIYIFDEQLQLGGTSGAPVLDAAGEVVAINVGGGDQDGYGTPVEAFAGPLLAACARRGPPASQLASFADARAGFRAGLVAPGPAPQEYAAITPPPGASEVRYRSGDLELPAWVSSDPGDGRRRPAVVYLHGGFAFDGTDWDRARPLIEAGFVVLAPRLRGENGAPGAFELFGGEVDDALAAGRHVASLPYVDPEAVFVCGHSVGGTLATLACMSDSPFRAGLNLSGATDVAAWLGPEARVAPFEVTDADALARRSPSAFPGSVRIPLRVYVGGTEGAHGACIERFGEAAHAAGAPVESFVVDDEDHMGMHGPALEHAIPWLRVQAAR